MKKQESNKHHYVPQFFIKGFSEDRKGHILWVYDKRTKKIDKSRKKASGEICYEWNKNTFSDIPEKPDALEKMYSVVEDRFTKRHTEILNGEMDFSIFEEYLAFILFQYLRLPINDVFVREILDTYSFSKLGYAIKDKKTGENISKEEEIRIANLPIWRQTHQLLFASYILMKNESIIPEIFRNSNIYKQQNLILSDNPIIFIEKFDIEKSIGEFIFPLNKDCTLSFYRGNVDLFIDDKFQEQKDLLLANQSINYVASPDLNYLEKIVDNMNNKSIENFTELIDKYKIR
jgi:hypothetical protein